MGDGLAVSTLNGDVFVFYEALAIQGWYLPYGPWSLIHVVHPLFVGYSAVTVGAVSSCEGIVAKTSGFSHSRR